jgi:hypothetical protein
MKIKLLRPFNDDMFACRISANHVMISQTLNILLIPGKENQAQQKGEYDTYA